MKAEDVKLGKVYWGHNPARPIQVHSVHGDFVHGINKYGVPLVKDIHNLSEAVPKDIRDWIEDSEQRNSKLPETCDLIEFLTDQRRFSNKAFGPVYYRLEGVLDHMTKEIEEVRKEPYDLTEWIDLVLLALDGAWRAGYTPREIAAGLNMKLHINQNRSWPDWRDQPEDKAIEHERDED